MRNLFFLWMLPLFGWATNPYQQTGYVEICDVHREALSFDSLYVHFDEFIEFLQGNPVWAQKLYAAKERFIRSKDKQLYSTDFFGFYDESKQRGQIAFYYSTHFHAFINSHFPELGRAPAIARFFDACLEIQKPAIPLFEEAAQTLEVTTKFCILLKVVKYFPSYVATRPHYDGSAFSLFLHSTDNESLLLAPYKSSFTTNDFSPSPRKQNSALLIPGALLAEFSILPTPHIVLQSGSTRFATIAFAMRPNYIPPQVTYPPLPNFAH